MAQTLVATQTMPKYLMSQTSSHFSPDIARLETTALHSYSKTLQKSGLNQRFKIKQHLQLLLWGPCSCLGRLNRVCGPVDGASQEPLTKQCLALWHRPVQCCQVMPYWDAQKHKSRCLGSSLVSRRVPKEQKYLRGQAAMEMMFFKSGF